MFLIRSSVWSHFCSAVNCGVSIRLSFYAIVLSQLYCLLVCHCLWPSTFSSRGSNNSNNVTTCWFNSFFHMQQPILGHINRYKGIKTVSLDCSPKVSFNPFEPIGWVFTLVGILFRKSIHGIGIKTARIVWDYYQYVLLCPNAGLPDRPSDDVSGWPWDFHWKPF